MGKMGVRLEIPTLFLVSGGSRRVPKTIRADQGQGKKRENPNLVKGKEAGIKTVTGRKRG